MRLLTLGVICLTSALIPVRAERVLASKIFQYVGRGHVAGILGENPNGARVGDPIAVYGKILIFDRYPSYDLDSLDDWYPGEYTLDAQLLSGPTWWDAGSGAYYYLEGFRHKTPWGEFSHRTAADGSYVFTHDGWTPFRILYSGCCDARDLGIFLDLHAGDGANFRIRDISGPITSFQLIAIPEPATVTMVVMAGALVLLRRATKRFD